MPHGYKSGEKKTLNGFRKGVEPLALTPVGQGQKSMREGGEGK